MLQLNQKANTKTAYGVCIRSKGKYLDCVILDGSYDSEDTFEKDFLMRIREAIGQKAYKGTKMKFWAYQQSRNLTI